jgi:hypothetical protein
MESPMKQLTCYTIALARAGPATAFAQDSNVDVFFDRGMNSKEIRSSITGDQGVNYMLSVRRGQVMQILFSTTRGSCYFNVWEPGNPDSAIHIGSSDGNEFGASPTKAGTYRVQVYQMRATARRNETCRYSISFEVTGEGSSVRPTAASGPSEVAKGACLYKIGVDAAIEQASALRPGYWEIIMQAKSGNRKVACTVNDSGVIADWVEMR